MPVNHGPSQQSSKEEYKPRKLVATAEDDFSESYQRIQQLKTPDTQDTDVNDLLPLALTNFIRGRVKIFCSRKACPISDAIPTIEQLSIFNPTYLALFVPQASQSIMLYVVHQRGMLDPIGFKFRRLLMDHDMFNQQILRQLLTPPKQVADPERTVTPPSRSLHPERTLTP